MQDAPRSTFDPPTLKGFTDNIANAAYDVVLRSGVCGCWIDLELDVWKALGETAGARWKRSSPRPDVAGPIDPAPEISPAELTDAAYRAALRHGLRSPFLEVELELYLTFSRAVERFRLGLPLRRTMHGNAKPGYPRGTKNAP